MSSRRKKTRSVTNEMAASPNAMSVATLEGDPGNADAEAGKRVRRRRGGRLKWWRAQEHEHEIWEGRRMNSGEGDCVVVP
jgi:hypothetical protein